MTAMTWRFNSKSDTPLATYTIRILRPLQDQIEVLDLYRRSADYIWSEVGRTPDPRLVEEYFADAPPGSDPATSLKLGLFRDEVLTGVGDLAFDYPNIGDAYIGRLMFAAEARGQGLGAQFLRYLEQTARDRGATRLLLSVLETNKLGRAFWEHERFGSPAPYAPIVTGKRTDVWIRLEKSL